MKPNGLVYLATPYSHPETEVKERRFQVVNKKAAELMVAGVLIFSPISHTHPIALAGDLPTGWAFWEKYDRVILVACVKIIVLRQEGWEASTGVRAEIQLAEEIGLPIEFIDP